MEKNQDNSHAVTLIIGIILISSVGYAMTRYILLGPVPWKDLSLFILNKGVSLGAFIMLILNFSLGPLQNLGVKIPASWMKGRMAIGMTSFFLVFLHVISSILLFKPVIYPKFFEMDGTLTATSGISMLGGILSFIILWGYNLTFKTYIKEDKAFVKFITSRKILLLAMFLGAVHLFFMGFKGWIEPGEWYGGLPPVSMVAFIFFLLGYAINLIGRK